MKDSTLPLPDPAPPLLDLDQSESGSTQVAEVHGSAAALLAGACAARLRSRLLLVTARESDASNLVLDLGALVPGSTVHLLPESSAHDPDSPEYRRMRSARERALETLREPGSRSVVVGSLRAFAARTGDPEASSAQVLKLRTGDRIDREALRHALFASGLDPSPLVEAPGQLSLRGDIADFFAFAAQSPVRIELFDEEVESIREFDPDTQRSTRTLEEVVVRHTSRKLVQSERAFDALDHCAGSPLVFLVDPKTIEQAIADDAVGLRPAEKNPDAVGLDAAGAAQRPQHPVPDRSLALRRLRERRVVELHPLFHAGAAVRLDAHPVHGALGIDDLTRWAQALDPAIRAIHLYSPTQAEGQRLTRLLRERLPQSPRRAVFDHRGSLAAGFQSATLGFWAGNHHELLSRTRLRRAEEPQTAPLRSLKEGLELSTGDHVVHQVHGIGLYRGMKEHSHDGGTEDYLIVEFADSALLFVPASKMEMLSRYVGPGGTSPKLDKIGGKSWTRKKDGVAAAIDELARDLIELHASRRSRPGHAYQPDDELQAEFEASFPFADTLDQVTASEEIKRDMESPRAMDRLLCGDVGFGKTEVALRAVYKCASQQKQAVVLAPTTLLVQQHLETFRNRFASEPFRIEALSRLSTSSQAHSILDDLAEGKVEVLIGTHRLLGSKVRFKDLGLVIIDEEQRFGVKHKEHLKMLKTSVDVLTLSATPIPRTLHMALVGLRDVSTLREPPRGRMPVKTVVAHPDDQLIRDAIEHELEREGQVFYLFNRVQPIQRVAARVKDLVPHAKVAVAHGQLAARELEKVSTRFARGECNVLVCTTIVESGIDLPNVNTLIVERADQMGLADLHQLRGRIGRGSRQAYAYFLIPDIPLPAIALKRLRALEGLAHLGAGFDIAIRDLEIRGAGNLLGREQSGQIASVGYDMYCQMLGRVIAKKQGRKPPPEPDDIDIGLGLPCFLPREYVRSTHQRMGLLRRMGEARSLPELDTIEGELRDRFGRIPRSARNLLDTFRLKDGCRRSGVVRVFYPGGGEVLLNVRELGKFNQLDFGKAEARWVEGSRVHLILPPRTTEPERVLAFLMRLLRCAPAPPPVEAAKPPVGGGLRRE